MSGIQMNVEPGYVINDIGEMEAVYVALVGQREADRLAFATADTEEKASIRKRARHRQCSINGLKAIEVRIALWYRRY